MSTENKYAAIHYSDYLELDKLLSSQTMRSQNFGVEAHDEMLFIITHQTYELWFKQLIHEVEKIHSYFGSEVLDVNLPRVNHYLNRCIRIVKLMVHQLEVLETMTPMDFLEFRNYPFPASGFQSYQFRVAEVMLGLKNKHRITYGGYHYAAFFDEKQKVEMENLENGTSILQAVEQWLERTPFINFGDFDFLKEYQAAVDKMLESEKQSIVDTDILSERQKEIRLKVLGDSSSFYTNIFDESSYNEKYENGDVRISFKAMQAALFISLYRDYPILQMPFQILEKLSELEEFLTLWRFRHTQMVKRIIGSKIGTGGSAGVNYLMETALKHTIFGDIQGITTLMVATADLPELPEKLKKELQFEYSR